MAVNRYLKGPAPEPRLRGAGAWRDGAVRACLHALYREIWRDVTERLAQPVRVSAAPGRRTVVFLDTICYLFDLDTGRVQTLVLVGRDRRGRGRYRPPGGELEVGAPLFTMNYWVGWYLRHWNAAIRRLAPSPADVGPIAGCLERNLKRALRRAVRLKQLRRDLHAAFALDGEVLALAVRARVACRRNVCMQSHYARVYRHRAAYRRVAKDAPNLLWLATLALSARVPLGTQEPVAQLKRALLSLELPERCWRLLANARRRDFEPLLEIWWRNPWIALARWLELHAVLDVNAPLPRAFQLALLREIAAPEGESADFYHWTQLHMPLALLRLAAREAVKRRREGTLARFIEEEYAPVSRWQLQGSPAIGRDAGRAGWQALLRRARAWHEREERRRRGADERWVSALAGGRYGAYDVVPLEDSYALWLEGVAMRHCVGTYTAACFAGRRRVFSVRRADDGRRAATLAIERDGNAWKLKNMKGFANSPVPGHVRALGKRLADDYTRARRAALPYAPQAQRMRGSTDWHAGSAVPQIHGKPAIEPAPRPPGIAAWFASRGASGVSQMSQQGESP